MPSPLDIVPEEFFNPLKIDETGLFEFDSIDKHIAHLELAIYGPSNLMVCIRQCQFTGELLGYWHD